MARRLTIGLRYRDKDAWVGGIYYVRNLVRALGLLPAARRPRLIVIGGDAEGLADLRKATGYSDLRRVSRSRLSRAPRLPIGRGGEDEIDVILLGAPPGLEDRAVQWIPDFQEHRFPQFFPPEELESRLRSNQDRLSSSRHLMVSSRDVAEDVTRYYGHFDLQTHVVRFASFTDPDLQPTDARDVRQRHALAGRYFICSNQFWRHKNHAVVLRALSEAREDPGAPPMVFTGLEEDYRDPAYGPSVRALAAELGVEDRVRFLGFLPRGDQLALIAGAVAVVQPSLCEGWSTVVEDAKALGRHVLASDIAVHREQLDAGVDLFEAEDHRQLARLLLRYRDADPPVRTADYALARQRFAGDLWDVVTEVERDLGRQRTPRILISP